MIEDQIVWQGFTSFKLSLPIKHIKDKIQSEIMAILNKEEYEMEHDFYLTSFKEIMNIVLDSDNPFHFFNEGYGIIHCAVYQSGKIDILNIIDKYNYQKYLSLL